MIYKLILFLLIAIFSLPSKADSIRVLGDYLQIALPAYAFGRTYGLDDQEGLTQMSLGVASNLALTQLIKKTTLQARPDGSNRLSFPSGHTSAAFQAASFIHKRYGWEKAWPHYIAASVVGYSRIESKRHYFRDVVAGAALGIGVSWYLTTPKDNGALFISYSGESFNISYTRTF